MAYKIIWSPEAEATFERIIEYLNERWTSKEITRFIERTEDTIFLLEQNPYLFRGSEKENIYEVLGNQTEFTALPGDRIKKAG